MLYVYDKAIQQDLANCIDPRSDANDIVKVIGPEGILPLIAQMQQDRIKFPLVCLIRNPDTPIDTSRTNFSMQHKGIPRGYNSEKNEMYLERSLPIQLSYTLNVLATNTVDADEFTKELLFRYTQIYFITANVKYDIERKLRFGVMIEPGSVKKDSGALEYIDGGKLYQTSMNLICQGAVLLSYVPKHVERIAQPKIEVRTIPEDSDTEP